MPVSHVADLDYLMRAMVTLGNRLEEQRGTPWPRPIRTALADWTLYPDDILVLRTGGDGAMVPMPL